MKSNVDHSQQERIFYNAIAGAEHHNWIEIDRIRMWLRTMQDKWWKIEQSGQCKIQRRP
jgi:hypothetical protein